MGGSLVRRAPIRRAPSPRAPAHRSGDPARGRQLGGELPPPSPPPMASLSPTPFPHPLLPPPTKRTKSQLPPTHSSNTSHPIVSPDATLLFFFLFIFISLLFFLFQMWPFELHAGVLRSAGRGSLPLSAVSAVRVDARVDAPMDARVGGGTQREPRRARPAELVLEVFVFAHPPISPICRSALFPHLTI